MRKLSKEQVLLLHTQLIEEFGGTYRFYQNRVHKKYQERIKAL